MKKLTLELNWIRRGIKLLWWEEIEVKSRAWKVTEDALCLYVCVWLSGHSPVGEESKNVSLLTLNYGMHDQQGNAILQWTYHIDSFLIYENVNGNGHTLNSIAAAAYWRFEKRRIFWLIFWWKVNWKAYHLRYHRREGSTSSLSVREKRMQIKSEFEPNPSFVPLPVRHISEIDTLLAA